MTLKEVDRYISYRYEKSLWQDSADNQRASIQGTEANTEEGCQRVLTEQGTVRSNLLRHRSPALIS